MKKSLLFTFFLGLFLSSFSQETCDMAIEIDPGTFTADVLTGSGASNICFGTGATNAAWYTITPQTSGFMTVSSCLGGTDTRLSVYNGSCDALNCLDSNDDFCEMTPGGNNFASQTISNVDSGSVYFIEWDDRWVTTGFDFSVMVSNCLDLVTNFNSVNYPTNAEITWNGNVEGTYNIEYGESGFTLGEGTTISGNLGEQPVFIDNLTPETGYDYYLFEICEEGDSTSTYQNTFTTTPLPPECGETFVDQGGSLGFYLPNESTITTICPDSAGNVVTVNFTSFDVNTFGDNLQVFNGPTTDSPTLGTFTGQDNIGAFVSSDTTGCLTFLFTSDGFTQSNGWEAEVFCGAPPSCPFPYQLSIDNVNHEGGMLTWINGNEANWLIEIVPAGMEPIGTGTSIETNPYTITGLESDTQYEVYISADCLDDGTSLWIGPVTFITQPSPPECGGVFTDSGGIFGNYNNNENVTYVICPDTLGNVVTLIFTDINIESCCDDLYIYDGPDATYPLIANLFGVNPEVSPITSTDPTGCLTIVFTSDGSVTPSGWEANVICGPPPTCPAPNNFSIANINTEGGMLSWTENGTATSWDIEIVEAGLLPTGEGFTVTENPYEISGLNSDTAYEVYINANCDNDLSFVVGPIMLITSPLPPECGGVFTDSGGAFGNYSNGENITTTICPDTLGNVVTVIFNDINIESCCDDLYIYDGPDATYPLIVNIFGVNPEVLPITSTDPTGCLTFVFTSDGSVTPSGWEADIICGPPPTCPAPTLITITDITPLGADVSWDQSGDVTSWEIEIIPAGGEPTGNGDIITDNPYIIDFLNPDATYDVYLNAWCSEEDESFNLGPFSFTTFPLPPECGGTFVDLGGANGFYGPNENTVTTICPDTIGNAVTVDFSTFNVSGFGDTLFVYNGPTIDSPSLGAYTDFNAPDPITSADTSGCLTFEFVSNPFGENEGWEANVTCAPPPSCFNPIQLTVASITSSGGVISWIETGNATSWNIEIVPTDTEPIGATTIIDTNPYFESTLNPSTTYDIYLTSNCGDELSAVLGPTTFTTGAIPPPNNFCNNAQQLIVNQECIITQGTNAGATGSGIIPGCAFYNGGDVWFSFVAPGGGNVTIQTSGDGGIGDSGLALYSGPCDSPVLMQCNDDFGGLFSQIDAFDLTPGEMYFAVVWEYGGDTEGTFGICITAPDAGCDVFLGDPIEEFNTTFGGAPSPDINGVCPLNQITDFEVTASELYSIDGCVIGETYTFNMCEGPGAGSWQPEITLLDDSENILLIVQGCELTWVATYSGTYLIGINEVGFCGEESQNTEVNNGYPTLTCEGSPPCTDYIGGPWTNFNNLYNGAPVADEETGICPLNILSNLEVWASEMYTVDNFAEGETYTFSICEGPNAGSWDPELMVMDSLFNPLFIEADCSITWTAPYSGTFILGINELGACGNQSNNTQTPNGNPSLTCLGDDISVTEIESDIQLNVYPNPAKDILNIKVIGLRGNYSQVNLMSMHGQLVLSNNYDFTNKQSQTIDVSGLSKGIYMLNIVHDQATLSRRVIIE